MREDGDRVGEEKREEGDWEGGRESRRREKDWKRSEDGRLRQGVLEARLNLMIRVENDCVMQSRDDVISWDAEMRERERDGREGDERGKIRVDPAIVEGGRRLDERRDGVGEKRVIRGRGEGRRTEGGVMREERERERFCERRRNLWTSVGLVGRRNERMMDRWGQVRDLEWEEEQTDGDSGDVDQDLAGVRRRERAWIRDERVRRGCRGG
ncbi:hypothetical protein Tco_0103531 [Tanacetum coccineum]